MDNSRVKSGDMASVSVGGGRRDEGGVIEIWEYKLACDSIQGRGRITCDLNTESEMVRDTGSRAKEGMG